MYGMPNNWLVPAVGGTYRLRSSMEYVLTRTRTKSGQRCFCHFGPIWFERQPHKKNRCQTLSSAKVNWKINCRKARGSACISPHSWRRQSQKRLKSVLFDRVYRRRCVKRRLTNFMRTNLTRRQLVMWANAQRDGRPAEHRWRPLINAAQFGWRPLLDAVQ